MSPIPGRVLGDRFELSRQVGAGGYAEVWLARDRGEGGKPVAVKVLRPEAAEDEEALARAIREARVLSALEHPHIARAGVAALDGDQPYFSMEWLANLRQGELGALWRGADMLRIPHDSVFILLGRSRARHRPLFFFL